MSKICFYYIKTDYIDYLKKYESDHRNCTCVPNIKYYSNEKFFYGTVLNVQGIDYYVPISSKTKGRQDDILIRNKKGDIKGSLRFNYMIPVPNKSLSMLDLKNGSFTEKQTIRIKEELAFCMRNKDKIQKQAQVTYDRIVEKTNTNLINNSCDFKLLETAYIIYCHDNDLPLSEELQKRYAEITGNKPTTESSISVQTPFRSKPQPPQKSQSSSKFSVSMAQLRANRKEPRSDTR